MDLGVPVGTEIRAGFTGVAARVNNGCAVGNRSCGAGYGNYIYLKASDGTCAVMAHLSRIDVAPGHQVQVYDVVGLSGNTGNSSGPHLHYDHVDCTKNRSLPWAPIEGGSLAEGATITSQNHSASQPCTALQGGCNGSIQGSNTPVQGGSSVPIQGGGSGTGGANPSVTLAQGLAAPSGYRYAITVTGFAANTSVSVTCYDSVSPGGFYTFGLSTDGSGKAYTASYCYSGDGPDHWVKAGGLQSNHVSWGGAGSPPPPPPPPPPPAASISAAEGGRYGCSNCYALNIEVHNFPTGTYTYYCHDNSGPGGSDVVFYQHAVTVNDPNQGTWPGVFCDDNSPYVAYLVMNGVTSNSVQF